MDTDDLTEKAWSVVMRASQVSDTLKTELGAMASRFKNEDEWLQGVRIHLEDIIEDPVGYADSWNLEDTERVTATMISSIAVELLHQVDSVLSTPINKRD